MKSISFPQAIRAALASEMKQDDRVFLIGEDIAHFGGMFRCTECLLEEFGESRVIDTPISESGFLGIALGAALAGKRPVVELMFIDFSLVAADQILNQIAKTQYMSGGTVSVPLVIRTQGGGYKGAAAQHSQMLESLFVHVPGLKVVAPSTPEAAAGLLVAAIRDSNPVLFIEHKQLYGVKGPVPETITPAEIGKARLARAGKDISIFSYSYSVHLCLEAAEDLAREGIDCEVIDLQTLNPLDWDAVATSVTKTHRALVVHEAHLRLGFGAELAAQIQEKLFDELDGPILRVGAADVPLPFSEPLERESLPSSARIAAAIRKALR